MGRIKELLEKVSKNEATDEEKVELEELQSEAADAAEGDDVDAELEKAADSIVEKATSKIDSRLDAVLSKIEAVGKSVEKTEGYDKANAYIVDKGLGKISLQDAAEKMVTIPARKRAGKEVTEVSLKTVHFANALLRGDVEKLQLLTEGTAAAGGYLVPEEFANMIVEDKRDEAVMRSLANQVTISGDTLHLPALDSRPKAAWRSEAAVKATSTAQFNELVFTPYSLAVIVGLSEELANDASLGVNGSIVNYVAGLMAQSLREKEEEAFWTGNGSGKPTGVNNYSLGSRDAGSSDSSFADAIKRTYFDLGQGYRRNAVWVGHSQAIARAATVKDSTGQYLLTMLSEDPYPRLNGAKVYEQNDLPTDVLFFGDFGYYTIVDRQGITVDISREATVAGSSAFEKNLVFIRAEERVDGELTLPAAVRKVTGLN